ASVPPADLRYQPETQRDTGEQTGNREHPVDRKFASTPEIGNQRERRPLEQGAAIHRSLSQECSKMAVHERVDGHPRFIVIVVPTKPKQAQPASRGRTDGGRDCPEGPAPQKPCHTKGIGSSDIALEERNERLDEVSGDPAACV